MPLKRVLLISINQCDLPYPTFPLGLAMIDAALREANYETLWHDFQWQQDDLESKLRDFAPDVVGISIRNIDDVQSERRKVFIEMLPELCVTIRKCGNSLIVLGGSGFSLFPERLMEMSKADYGVAGEGESVFVELLQSLEQGKSLDALAGLVRWKDSKAILQMGLPKPQKSFGRSTRPDESISYYLQTSGMLNVQTQRGCPLRCCYCTYPVIEGKSVRRRDPEEVAQEFKDLERRGIRYVFIVDSVFNMSPDYTGKVCEALVRHQSQIKWCCFLRPAGISQDLANLMAKAGLSHVEFGTDSFCDPVLKEYGKDFKVADVIDSSNHLHRAGVKFVHFLMLGGPGETFQTMDETFENSLRLEGGVYIGLAGARVYPGTSLYRRILMERPELEHANLIEPHYYFAPGMERQEIFSRLKQFRRKSSRWLVGSVPSNFVEIGLQLRKRGVLGPLWDYYEVMMRMALAEN